MEPDQIPLMNESERGGPIEADFPPVGNMLDPPPMGDNP